MPELSTQTTLTTVPAGYGFLNGSGGQSASLELIYETAIGVAGYVCSALSD